MNTQKLLFILLVTLVVVFLFGIMAGQRNRANPSPVSLSDLSSSSLNALVSAPLNVNELRPAGSTPAQCLQTGVKQFVIASNSACTYEIAASAMPTRKLGLHLVTAGTTVNVALQQNRSDAFDVAQKLPGDEPLTLSIFNADKGKTVTLSLTCVSNPAKVCRVAIQ